MEIQEHSGSYVLTSIAKAFEKLCDGFHLRLGDGGSSFWFEDLNIALEVSFVDVHDIGLRVCDVVNGEHPGLTMMCAKLEWAKDPRCSTPPLYLLHNLCLQCHPLPQ